MSWIVLGEENGKIKLVSKSDVPALLPKGSYLTIEQNDAKFILRIDRSEQTEPYNPSPMIVDMDQAALEADQKCQNIMYAYRVKDLKTRDDGFIDYIRPQSVARKANQEEINLALNSKEGGLSVFVATVHSGQNQLLREESGKLITAHLPEEMYYHQMLVCGKTGSGKTNCTKYLAQHFIESFEGAVLAINVKDVDFLKMDKPSETANETIKKEWDRLTIEPKSIDSFVVYHPAISPISPSKGVTKKICKPITLSVSDIDPEALTGLLQGITDAAGRMLPNIFRHWKEEVIRSSGKDALRFSEFIQYFINRGEDRRFQTVNARGDISEIPLHRGTYDSILRNLDSVSSYFDNEDAVVLDESHILEAGKMSVIDVSNKDSTRFGAIMLRHLLKKIVDAKENQKYDVPVLLIIDEVHQFYNTTEQVETLGELNTICRQGRSQKIGVVFSSQNPTDIPIGLSSVINTKIFFNSNIQSAKKYGMNISGEELESLKKGYAHVSVFEMPQLKIVKFPLSTSGVFDKK